MHGRDTTVPDPDLESVRPLRDVPPQRTARTASRRPTRRAVVGGLLVALAALIAWIAVDAGDRRPGRSIVIATRAIAPGESIDASAVTVRTMSIDASLADHDFSSTSQLVDAVALGPIAEGDAILRSAVLPNPSGERLRQFSFPVDRDRALNGELRAGERIDVMATFGSGTDSITTVIARDALVLRIADQKSGTLGSTGRSILTIGLASADQVLDAVHAAQVADLTVVRSTLAGGGQSTRATAVGPSNRTNGVRP